MVFKTNLLFRIFVCIFLSVFLVAESKSPCNFPAIYNFGDSNSDTSLYFTAPNGSSIPIPVKEYPGKPKRPYTDGRTIIDFIAEKLGKPYLSSYLDKVSTNFDHGANFAVGGSTIVKNTYGTSLPVETDRFSKLKAETSHVLNIDYSKALFTMDIGLNDVFQSMYGSNVKVIPDLMRTLADGVKKLYHEGARVFWIQNTGPAGCLVGIHERRPPYVDGTLDEFGCLKSYNVVAFEFNKQLKDKVIEMRAELNEATITYVDLYTPKYELFKNGKELGFPNPLAVCVNKNGPCSDPDNYVLFDGIHFGEAADRYVAQSVLDGKFSDPPLPIDYACYKN